MKIVVSIKQVPATGADKRYTDDLRLDRAGAEAIINPLDEYAIEQALRLVDSRRRRSRHLPVDGSRAGVGGATARARHGRRRRGARHGSRPRRRRRVGHRPGACRGPRQAGAGRGPDGHGLRRRARLAGPRCGGRPARRAAPLVRLGAPDRRRVGPRAAPLRDRASTGSPRRCRSLPASPTRWGSRATRA